MSHVSNVLLQIGLIAALLASVSNMIYVMSTGGQPDRIIVPVLIFTVIVVIWSETHPVESSGDEHRVE